MLRHTTVNWFLLCDLQIPNQLIDDLPAVLALAETQRWASASRLRQPAAVEAQAVRQGRPLRPACGLIYFHADDNK